VPDVRPPPCAVGRLKKHGGTEKRAPARSTEGHARRTNKDATLQASTIVERLLMRVFADAMQEHLSAGEARPVEQRAGIGFSAWRERLFFV
jgi:hypothetical protein